jgi:hypothetical protein
MPKKRKPKQDTTLKKSVTMQEKRCTIEQKFCTTNASGDTIKEEVITSAGTASTIGAAITSTD